MWTEETPWVWDGSPPPELVSEPEPPPANADVTQFVPPSASMASPFSERSVWSGDKFDGSFGYTQLFEVDYWTLRARSAQLFRENLYARGIVRRLVTNEINWGLSLESRVDELLLARPEDSLADWKENHESRFQIWGDNPKLCDWKEQKTFAEQQAEARTEAIISGDVLCVLHQDPITKLPKLELINGAHVQTPLDTGDKKVIDGVELDSRKRHTGYHVTQEDGTSKRIPAWGARSGRRLAWLVYGVEKRADDIRGEPLLGILLTSLKEIDRYRDNVQRKSTINSILAAFVTKTDSKIGTNPFNAGALRTQTATQAASTDAKTLQINDYSPGIIIDGLQAGEDIKFATSQGIDEKFGEFEEAIVQAMSWCLQIPPEIMRLAFSNNYSASQAAINEFRMYLNMVRAIFATQFCKPIHQDWFIAEILTGRMEAAGFLDAWRDPLQYVTSGTWLASDWTGAIKPSTDIVKQAKGYGLMVDRGWITNERAARELTGTKYSKNVRILAREIAAMQEAQPTVEPEIDEKRTIPKAA